MGVPGGIGKTGATGADGVSQVKITPLIPWTLSTGTPGTSATSSAFGQLVANSSYEFTVVVTGKLANWVSPGTGIRVGLLLATSDPAASLNYGVSYSFGTVSEGLATYFSKESFLVTGTIATSLSTPITSLMVTINDAGGTTGTNAMSLSGIGFFQLVGSIL